jgi:uncharacterized membrane protein YjgN (DUF898 family)
MNANNGGPPGSDPWTPATGGFGPVPDGVPYRQGLAPTRGTFAATGAAFIGMFLLLKGLPILAGGMLGFLFGAMRGAQSLDSDPAYNLLSALINLAALPLGIIYSHELVKFEWNHAVLDGRTVRYRGDLWTFVSALAAPALVACCTLGLYTPWLMCAYYRYVFEHSDVEGERLEFAGTGGDLFGVMLLNGLLTIVTLGLYWPWAANNVWAWYWQRTGLNGRPFTFRSEGGEFFGVALLGGVLTVCTLGLYWPWAAASFRKWELEHVT